MPYVMVTAKEIYTSHQQRYLDSAHTVQGFSLKAEVDEADSA